MNCCFVRHLAYVVWQEAVVRSKCELEAVAREFAASKPDTRQFSLDREQSKVLRELRMDKTQVTRGS